MADWSLDHIARVRNKAATGDGLGPFWRELVVEALDQLAAAKSSPPTAMPIRATKATESTDVALLLEDARRYLGDDPTKRLGGILMAKLADALKATHPSQEQKPLAAGEDR